MGNFSENTLASKERLQEITHKIDEEGISTEELLNMLEEALNIGMNVCTQAQNNIDEQISQETSTSDVQK